MIATYLQVLSVLALICAGAAALGNEVRLWIDEHHADRDQARVGRHAEVDGMVSLVRRFDRHFARQRETAALFADVREAFESAADTVWLVRP